ncbi:MAG TPA: glycosyltransferase family 4 protein [Sphingobacteriaceae bacterium]
MPTSKPKVLIIENSIDVTGALKSVARTAFDLSAFYEFVFIIPTGSKARAWIEGKRFSNVYELPMRELSRSIVSLVKYFPYLFVNAFQLRRIVKQENVMLIHVNDIYNMLPLALRILGSKTPYICHVRFLPDRFPNLLFGFWLKLHLKCAERLVAVSESVRAQLPPHEKIVVIHNELPVEERYERTLKKEDTYSKTFLYLSNFMNGKGQNFAIDAFSRVHGQLPGWKLRLVGGDMGLAKNMKFREYLKELAVSLGVSHKLEWSDFTEDVEREYKLADIVLNFSESESFSITCLEALFFGRPLIVTDCGGPAEIVNHQITGLLIPNRDVQAMAQNMLALALDAQMREMLSRNGADTVRKKFNLENTSLRLKAVYDTALAI